MERGLNKRENWKFLKIGNYIIISMVPDITTKI